MTLETVMQPLPFETDRDIEAAIRDIERPIPLAIEPGDVNFCGQVVDGVFRYRIGIETPKLREIKYRAAELAEKIENNPSG